ncbi:hypothetical protein AGMMS49546_37170 [Spirochaetia bacterium]|nr:hypothetical protein AGMMS49546_37170 [Spirochaetia bacterium]
MDLPRTKEELYGTYYLKEDLINMCKEYNLPANGSKEHLLEYIYKFIENKSVKRIKSKRISNNNFEPSPDKIIDINYSNNEIHRIFFKEIIGEKFKYNVQFMNWMDKNKGKKTYKEAIEMYKKILLDKKSGEKTKIGKQFEYNQYTRDFFENNPELSREGNLGLLLLCAPGLLFFLIFNYIPMAGFILAFKNFNIGKGIFGSDWSGFDNFRFLIFSADIWRITLNTLVYNIVFIVLNLIVSLIFALVLDEIRSRTAVKIYQTIMFFPHFVSWVVAGFMLYAFLQSRSGLLNQLIGLFGITPKQWYQKADYWPAILTVAFLWKNVGYSTLIYYAGLLAIDRTLYEAAAIDGAKHRHIVFKIKLPSLSPLITIMIIMKIGQIFYADFGMFYNLPRDIGILYRTTDVIDTYVFRSLKVTGNIGMGTAAGLFQAVIGLLLVLITNYIVTKTDPDKALF